MYAVEYTAAELAPPSEYTIPPYSSDGVLTHTPPGLAHEAMLGDAKPFSSTRVDV